MACYSSQRSILFQSMSVLLYCETGHPHGSSCRKLAMSSEATSCRQCQIDSVRSFLNVYPSRRCVAAERSAHELASGAPVRLVTSSGGECLRRYIRSRWSRSSVVKCPRARCFVLFLFPPYRRAPTMGTRGVCGFSAAPLRARLPPSLPRCVNLDAVGGGL